MSVTDPIRKKEDIERLINYYLSKKQYRNYLLVVLGIYTLLRVSDILKLKFMDVYNFNNDRFKSHIELIEQKTKKKKKLAINEVCIEALQLYIDSIDDFNMNRYIFKSNRESNRPISRIQAHRILKQAGYELDMNANLSCHSLRKTRPYHEANQKDREGKTIGIIMEALNHASYESTKRYLGISQDELDEFYLSSFM